MRIELGATGILAVVGIGLAGLVAWRVYKTGDQVAQAAADLVKTDLNPANPGNIVNSGLSSIVGSISGDESFRLDQWLGGAVFDLTHTDPADPSRNTAIAAVNPADADNLVNRGLSKIVGSISGDESFRLDRWLADQAHYILN